jgi:hypothetical protein
MLQKSLPGMISRIWPYLVIVGCGTLSLIVWTEVAASCEACVQGRLVGFGFRECDLVAVGDVCDSLFCGPMFINKSWSSNVMLSQSCSRNIPRYQNRRFEEEKVGLLPCSSEQCLVLIQEDGVVCLRMGKELVRGCHGKPQNILAGVPSGMKSGTAANVPR